MDKEKQIEEIKNIMIKECIGIRTALEDAYQNRYAKALYNAGYRKIPEGSVVLSKKEYGDYLRRRNEYVCAKELYGELQSSNKRVYESLDNFKDQARKQAVKEFIQAITKDVDTIYHNATSAYVDIDDIHHIAIDKFGVEL